jgi:tetratricopeptide (TPR) repeat protein
VSETELSQLRADLADLGRRVEDQAALTRKTQGQVASLADSVAQVVERQRKDNRRLGLNSFVAYLLFTLLLGGGFYALYRARTGPYEKQRDDALAQLGEIEQRVGGLESELVKRKDADQAAYDYYQLIRKNQRDKVVSGYGSIAQAQLTPTEREMFAEAHDRARSEIVDAGYLTGLDAFRRRDYDVAVTELRRGLAYQAEGARAAEMRYHLGVALYKKGEPEEAASVLSLALAGGVEKAGYGDTRFYLASALEQLGRFAEARTEYDRFATDNPQSPLAPAARHKSAQLARAAVPRN